MKLKTISRDGLYESVCQCVENWDIETLIIYAQDTMLELALEREGDYVVLDTLDNSFLAGPFDRDTAEKEANEFEHAYAVKLER